MATNMGRGIIAPDNHENILTGAAEMRTLGATTAAAINAVDVRVSSELATKIGKTQAYEVLLPRDEAVRYGIAGPRGPEGPVSNVPGPPGPGGSIALEETDPGCFVDSEITWMQWPQSGGLPAVWNPNTQSYENPITVDTSVGTRVFVGDTMIYGDTGWRDVSHLLQDDWTGTAYIKRENHDVSVVISANIVESLQGTSRSTRRRLLQLPLRFYGVGPLAYLGRGQAHVQANLVGIDMGYGINMLDYVGLSGSGQGDLGVWTGSALTVTYTFPVNDVWPAALPGTPL